MMPPCPSCTRGGSPRCGSTSSGCSPLAVLQSWLLPPGENSALFNVAVFGVGALVVVVALTVAERRIKRG